MSDEFNFLTLYDDWYCFSLLVKKAKESIVGEKHQQWQKKVFTLHFSLTIEQNLYQLTF